MKIMQYPYRFAQYVETYDSQSCKFPGITTQELWNDIFQSNNNNGENTILKISLADQIQQECAGTSESDDEVSSQTNTVQLQSVYIIHKD